MSDTDTDTPKERRSFASMERHIQTILIAAITGCLGFAANYMFSDTQSKAVLRTEMSMLTSQVIEMRGDLRALQNSYVRRDDYEKLELRIRSLETGKR